MRIYLRYAFINNSQRQKISFRPSFQKKIQMLGVLFFLWMRTFITTSSSIKNLQHKYASGTDQLVTGKGPSKALLCEGTVLKLCGTTCRAPLLVPSVFSHCQNRKLLRSALLILHGHKCLVQNQPRLSPSTLWNLLVSCSVIKAGHLVWLVPRSQGSCRR